MGYLEAEKGKMSNAFLFNYITHHGFISFLIQEYFWRSQNISEEEYFRRGARDLECYKRMRFTSVILSLQS